MGNALDKAENLAGDLNGVWDSVVRDAKGTPQEGESKRLAQIIEDLERDVQQMNYKHPNFRGLASIAEEIQKLAVGYSDNTPYGQLQQIRRDLTEMSGRASHIKHPEAEKVEKMIDQVRRYIYDLRE